MKKKVVLFLMLALLLVCVMAVAASAAEMTQYCDTKVSLLSGEVVTAYFKVSTVNEEQAIDISKLYKTTDTDGGEYAWTEVFVLDMRNYKYYGTEAPTNLTGVWKRNAPTRNVRVVYLPNTITTLPANSFKSWPALEDVYIPKSVEVIGQTAFMASSIANVYMEEDSNLTTIENGAFRQCSNLTSFDFEVTSKLKSIGTYAFCLASIGGTVKLPNSIESIAEGAFNTTKIESISFGNGPLTLGKNVIGCETDTYLRTVYIPISTSFTEGTIKETWFASNETISFYVVSDANENAVEFIDLLKSSGRLIFATKEEVDDGLAPDGYNAVIYESSNVCDAFNNGAHNLTGDAQLVYIDAFTSFFEAKQCAACGRTVPAGDSFAPIISLTGYSTRENGTGFVAEYKIDRTSYNKFREYRPDDTLAFGAIISVLGDGEDAINVVDVDAEGNVTAKNTTKTAVLDIPDTYAGFTLKLSGFDVNAYANLRLVLCAFAYDGENVGYLTQEHSEVPTAITVGQILEA